MHSIAIHASIEPHAPSVCPRLPFSAMTGVFAPNGDNKEAYDKNYAVFRKLWKANRDSFRILNAAAD